MFEDYLILPCINQSVVSLNDLQKESLDSLFEEYVAYLFHFVFNVNKQYLMV